MTKTIHKPVFFLPVEYTHRELDYKLNFARHICNNNIDVIIGNPFFIHSELVFKNYQGGFLVKGPNPTPDFYRQLKEQSILLYSLNDEGGRPEYVVTYQPAVDALKAMEYIFLWGQCSKDELIKLNVDEELNKKYKVTGYPGFEFSLPCYKNYHMSLRPKDLPKEYILVNTSFAASNTFPREEWFKTCTTISPESKKHWIDYVEKEKCAFEKFYEWLKQIISNFPTETFYIRPHPAEKEELYQKYFAEFNNVLISKKGPVTTVMTNAKMILLNQCATALQGYLMGIPVITLAQSNLDYLHTTWSINFATQPKSVEEACYYINYVLKYQKLPPEVDLAIQKSASEITQHWFNNIHNSSTNVLSTILSEMNKKFANFQPYKLIDNRTLLQKAKFFIRRYLPLHFKVPLVSRLGLIKFTKKDILQRLRLLEEIDGITCNFNIKKLFPNAYLITKK